MAPLTTTFWRFSRFAQDAAGLEKTLRFLQAVAQICAFYLPLFALTTTGPITGYPSASATDAKTDPSTAINITPFLTARAQLGIGRRYLRFFKFVDCFAAAHQHLQAATGVVSFLEFGRWSALGMYLGLESCTILDATSIYPTLWAGPLLIQAFRFWFYSLSFSLLLSFINLYNLLATESPTPTTTTNEKPTTTKTKKRNAKQEEVKPGEEEKKTEIDSNEKATKRQAIVKKIIIDTCDILIPGAVVGWLPVSAGVVGLTTVVGTLLSSGEIWERM